jgi:hypothetical protein
VDYIGVLLQYNQAHKPWMFGFRPGSELFYLKKVDRLHMHQDPSRTNKHI